MHAPSLRWRLFLMLSASTLLVWLCVSWFVHTRLLHEVDEIYDGQLQQSGRILAGIIRAGGDKIGLSQLRAALPVAPFDGTAQLHSIIDRQIHHAGKYERVIGFQIVDPKGTVLFRSPGAPAAALSARQSSGFNDAEIGGVRWRVCSFPDKESDRVIHIGEQYAVRREISSYLLHSMGIPVLLGIIAVAVLIWLSVEWGLKPLPELARQVRDRKSDDLSAVEMRSASTEIRPIVSALNTLLARLRSTFDNERRFTGDAAHELRTPLAAVKVQSQVAMRATDETECRTALAGVLAGVDRATHLVSQLLDLSRLDWQHLPEPRGPVVLTSVTERVAADLAEYARDRGVSVNGHGDTQTQVSADEALLSMLVRNLLDNAIRYSGTGGKVHWSVSRQDKQILLEVADTGPGIPANEQQAVFERFRRLPGSNGSGSGLGLSIVRKIADRYGAEITLSDPTTGRGLKVTACFHSAMENGGVGLRRLSGTDLRRKDQERRGRCIHR